MLSNSKYNDYFIIDKEYKKITLLNDFTSNNKRPFVVLTAS